MTHPPFGWRADAKPHHWDAFAAQPPELTEEPVSALTFEQSTSAITRICGLQVRLLDHTGHVARGLSRDDRRILLDEIQRLRRLVGWEPLDMTGRTRREVTR